MKKILSVLLTTSVMLTSIGSVFAGGNMSGTIISPDPHADQHMMEESYVAWAYQHGLTKYQYIKDFRYDDPISRQEAAKMLVQSMDTVFNIHYASVDNICNTPYFDAKKFDKTLAPFIFEACAYDMMHGYNGYFSPTDNILKSESIATILRAVLGMDDTKVSPWYRDYTDKAASLGITSLKNAGDDTMFQDITRGELIEWLYTIKQNMK